MDASIIVCTYDRAHLVPQVIDDLLAQEVPEDLEWEIVVVDNNSRDRTREVLDAYAQRHPERIRHLFEGRQGKSFALNHAIKETKGELLLFTDDDVRVDPNWVAEIAGFLGNRPEVLGMGGKVLPILPTSPEPALDPEEIARFFRFDFGDVPCRIDQNPFGANMAYRREAFDRHGNFRTDLGPTEEDRGGLGEDSEFARRVLDAHEQIWYLPGAVIQHAVHADELTPAFLDQWHFLYGRALLRRTGVPEPMKLLFSVPRFLFRGLAEAWFAWLISPTARIRRRRHWQVQKVRGQIYEARRIFNRHESTGVASDESLGHRT